MGLSVALPLFLSMSLKFLCGKEESVSAEVAELFESLSMLEFELWLIVFEKSLIFSSPLFDPSLDTAWFLWPAASALEILSIFFHLVRLFWNHIFTCNKLREVKINRQMPLVMHELHIMRWIDGRVEVYGPYLVMQTTGLYEFLQIHQKYLLLNYDISRFLLVSSIKWICIDWRRQLWHIYICIIFLLKRNWNIQFKFMSRYCRIIKNSKTYLSEFSPVDFNTPI